MTGTYDRDLCKLLRDESWVKRISKMIYMLAYPYLRNYADAENVTQEVLRTLWEGRARLAKSFDPKKGSWENYISMIGRNAAIAESKRRGRSTQLDEEQVVHLESRANDAETRYELIEREERLTLIRECCNTLKEDEKQLILMCDLQGRDWKDVLKVLDCKDHNCKVYYCPGDGCRSNLRVRRHRACGKLKECVVRRTSL
jgi:RNA polymerase sigma factor (sigma-70 family)